jgi:hypothetical protein
MFPWLAVFPFKKNGIRTDPDAALGLTVSVARPPLAQAARQNPSAIIIAMF